MPKRCFVLWLLLSSFGLSAKTVRLTLYPPEIRIHAGEGQTTLLLATDAEGVTHEVTNAAQWQTSDRTSAVFVTSRTLQGLRSGVTRLNASYQGMTISVPVEVMAPRTAPLSFINDIAPIFTRASCASSNCHGSVRGQKGFKLSLFGSDPELDYAAITSGADGRRIDKAEPAKSLVLAKPTMQLPHGGGLRFAADSEEYAAMLRWLQKGAPYDSPGQARLRKLSVYPPQHQLVGIGDTLQLVAVGEYDDGSIRDLTQKVNYTSNLGAIASVTPSGSVRAEIPGETAIMARTSGKAAAIPVLVVKDRPMRDYPETVAANYIDKQVFAKLRTINVVPSKLSTDEEFVRRVFLDTVGHQPSLQETLDFLRSQDSGKREQLIDRLLERPERADFWAMRFADMFRAGYNEAGQKGGGAYGRWFRDQVKRNVPYDRMVRELLVSQGRHDFEGPSNFYFVSREITPEESGTNVSQLLLGLQIECARCHNHPFEKWSQDDFYGFAAFFARVGRKDMYQNNHNATYLKQEGSLLHPKTKKAVVAKYLDGDYEQENPGEDVREKLAHWVTASRNPYFARATVNRFWKFFMGRGLVEPVDDFRVTNPSTNEPLLEALAADFINSGYDIKHLERRILNSRTYGLSSEPNDTNREDQVNYSHFLVRRLMSEQILDSMTELTGIPEKLPSMPLGTRAMTVPVLPFLKPHYMMKVFGRSDLREVICERDTKPSVAQVMHLVSGETLQHQVTGIGGHMDKWLADPSLTDREVMTRLYLAGLSRGPSEEELQAALIPLQTQNPGKDGRRKAYEDLLWTIFNSKEFLFHH